jgi:cytoskeletal protein RodZ
MELVEALASLVGPMDEILADHKKSQALQRKLIRWMIVGCVLMTLLIAGLCFVLYQQWFQGQLQQAILTESYHQKRAIDDQGRKTDDVVEKLDQQPKISVRPPASTDPTGNPVVVIETPAPTSKPQSPDSSATVPKPAPPRVEIPIKLPSPKEKE